MLIISPNTVITFQAQQRQNFVEKAVAHASQFDPNGFGALEISARREFVLSTIEVAEHFGITGQASTIFLLEARCVQGQAFPSGKEHEWARNLLAFEWADETRTVEYVRDTAVLKARERGGSGHKTRMSYA
jgi:hypothetical protein